MCGRKEGSALSERRYEPDAPVVEGEWLPPEGERRYTAPVPVVTYALLAINAAVFLLDLLSGGQLLIAGAKWGPAIWHGEVYRLLTPIFLHAGLVHLLTNSWALFAVGPMVEGWVGPARFLVLYLFSGVAGSAAGLLFNPMALSVGASGAIFGLFGYLLFLRLRVPSLLPPGMKQWLSSLLVVNLVITFLPGTRIDVFGHLGGLAGGMLGGLLVGVPSPGPWGRRGRWRRWLEIGTAIGALWLVLRLGLAFPG